MGRDRRRPARPLPRSRSARRASSNLKSVATAPGSTTALPGSCPAKARIASIESHRVSTRNSISRPCAWRTRDAPRKPAIVSNSGTTRLRKCSDSRSGCRRRRFPATRAGSCAFSSPVVSGPQTKRGNDLPAPRRVVHQGDLRGRGVDRQLPVQRLSELLGDGVERLLVLHLRQRKVRRKVVKSSAIRRKIGKSLPDRRRELSEWLDRALEPGKVRPENVLSARVRTETGRIWAQHVRRSSRCDLRMFCGGTNG